MNISQKVQENQYSLPYHYIPQYKNFTQSISWSWGINYISAIEFILDEINKVDFKSIADIGCGDGRLTKEISKKFKDKEVIGIDYSKKAINLANVLNPDLNFINTDITKNLIEKKFDVATLIEVFEHIPKEDCNLFVEAIYKTLNNNGLLLLTVPHKNKPLNEKHFQHFDLELLKQYFEKHFDIIEVKYIEKLSKGHRLFKLLIHNSFYILNNQKILNNFYKIYKKLFLFAEEKNVGRIYLKLKKK